jgi:hypothetical protein
MTHEVVRGRCEVRESACWAHDWRAATMFIRGISMQELDVIDLPDSRRGTIVHVSSDHAMIIVEVGSDLTDYLIEENGLKEIARMTVGP